MKRKKDFEFKLKKICLYWYYVHFLRKYSIFLFTQNLVKSDLCMYSELKNNNVECKVVILKDWMLHKFFSNIKQNWEKIRNFECLIGLKNIEDILKTEKILKESKVLIKGYFVQNVFFFF